MREALEVFGGTMVFIWITVFLIQLMSVPMGNVDDCETPTLRAEYVFPGHVFGCWFFEEAE